ncbi:MAG: spore gernimation protein [Ruminococcaceae bacterium]|nr:spore gernimation protein [Oscillospiraceae bacterium]
MSKISSKQLATAFVASRLTTEMIMIPGELIRYGSDRFIAILIAKLMVLLLYLPLLLLTRKYKGDNFVSAAIRRNRIYGIILSIIFGVVLTSVTVNSVLNLQLYITDTLLGELLLISGVALITGASVYGAVKGVSAVTRTAVFGTSIFGFLIILIIITMSDKMDFSYLYPATIEDGNYFFRAFVSEVSCNSEILIFAVLCKNIESKPNKTVYYSLAVIFVLLELVNLIYNLILGPYLNELEYPLYVISSLSDIVIFQRLDGIDAIVWLLCGIIKIALLFTSMKEIYTTASKKPKAIWFLIIYALLVTFICMITGSDRRYYDLLQTVLHTAVPLVIAGTVIPLLVLFTGKKKPQKEENYEKD